MIRLKLKNLLMALITFSVISGCGFKLRGDQQLPSGIETVRLSASSAQMPLQRQLEKQLTVFKIPFTIDQTPTQEPSVLDIRILGDELNRRLLSLFPTGQVAEYELILSVRYMIAFPGREPQQVEFEVTREYQDDPDQVLAKSRELDLILDEMRADAADRIIRLMASQVSSVSNRN